MYDTPRSPEDEALVSSLVGQYLAQKTMIRNFLGSLDSFISGAIGDGGPLEGLVHSVKYRMKDPTHLRAKLFRKMDEERAKGKAFDIDNSNLFLRMNDLGGYRILHLHTSQTAEIHRVLLDIFDQASFDLHEPPYANIWDDEARKFFSDLGIRTELNPRMYSSVHYVLRARSTIVVTLEIQVRTLADEIWGEIDHKINYPEAHPSVACREQIRVLARVASSCSRLVDSIMVSHTEYDARPSKEHLDLDEDSERP
jgi:putative GTP pyrophosphokinase